MVPKLVVVLLAAAGVASGASAYAEVEATSGSPVRLDGEVAFRATEGALSAHASSHRGAYAFYGVSGEATLWTWTRQSVSGATGLQEGDAVAERILLRDATLSFTVDGRWQFAAEPVGGTVEVLGPVSAKGTFETMRRDYTSREEALFDDGRRHAPQVAATWEEGWAFVGDYPYLDEATSFPFHGDATARLSGAFVFAQEGGTVVISSAEGERVVRLGIVEERRHVSAGAVTAARQSLARLFLDGTFTSSEIPLHDWGLGAPALETRVDGTLGIPDASGRVSEEGRTVDFEHAAVDVVGAFSVRPSSAALAIERRYDAAGEVDVFLDGRPALAPPGPGVPVARGAGIVGLLAALAVAVKVLLALYTRLKASDLLAHPTRRRIHEVVSAARGIHKSALHRAVGGSWGVLAFHIGVLRRAGYLRAERRGAYTAYYADAGARAAPFVSPASRRILDAIPGDGPVGLGDLAKALATSRQRLRYHVRKLEKDGLAHFTTSGGRVAVRRGPAPRPAERS